MHIFIGSNKVQQGPLVRTRVLNKEECHVAAVGVTAKGELCFRRSKAFFPCQEIKQTTFFRSRRVKGMERNCAVEADFDIITTEGEVIEVWSCDRDVIQAALRYAPVVDIRERSRAARRVENGRASISDLG